MSYFSIFRSTNLPASAGSYSVDIDGCVPNVNILISLDNIRPVTPEVAGSGPVSLAIKAITWIYRKTLALIASR